MHSKVTIITDNVGHTNRMQIIKEFDLSIPDSMDDFKNEVLVTFSSSKLSECSE